MPTKEPLSFNFVRMLSTSWSLLSHVGPQCQGSEDYHDHQRPSDGKPEVVANGSLVEELSDGTHYVGQRIDIDEVLKP